LLATQKDSDGGDSGKLAVTATAANVDANLGEKTKESECKKKI
jgi:hypothetical protein